MIMNGEKGFDMMKANFWVKLVKQKNITENNFAT